VAIRIVDPLRLLEIALSMRSMIRCFSAEVPDGRLKIPPGGGVKGMAAAARLLSPGGPAAVGEPAEVPALDAAEVPVDSVTTARSAAERLAVNFANM